MMPKMALSRDGTDALVAKPATTAADAANVDQNSHLRGVQGVILVMVDLCKKALFCFRRRHSCPVQEVVWNGQLTAIFFRGRPRRRGAGGADAGEGVDAGKEGSAGLGRAA